MPRSSDMFKAGLGATLSITTCVRNIACTHIPALAIASHTPAPAQATEDGWKERSTPQWFFTFRRMRHPRHTSESAFVATTTALTCDRCPRRMLCAAEQSTPAPSSGALSSSHIREDDNLIDSMPRPSVCQIFEYYCIGVIPRIEILRTRIKKINVDSSKEGNREEIH
ncbi:hypothetical protein BGW80DRAFT_1533025 [Lactifluus volemus]|nr:hypothetical protein BGW80DRAFT_1533025 [Lactifluus volemus]